jgi:cysteine synthase A
MIAEAESGALGYECSHLVEPTSGNTGMGLAMIANLRGLKLTTPLSKAIRRSRTALRFLAANH